MGKHTVGRTQMDFAYTASDSSYREVTAVIFYPSDAAADGTPAQYTFPEFPDLWDVSMEANGFKVGYRFNFGIETCCFEDLPLSDSMKDYPVVFYNHGGTTYPEQNTAVCQELASAGYVVVSVAHPGSGAFRMKDGRVIDFTKEFLDTLDVFSVQPDMIAFAPEIMGGVKLEKGRALELSGRILTTPESMGMARFAQLQAEDVSYVADCLYKMNEGEIESPFKGRLRLGIGVGAFGHSFGGATSAIAARNDERIVCAINYDGGMMGSGGRDIGKPFLLLGNTVSYNLNADPLAVNSGDTWFVLLDNVVHFDFGDFPFNAGEEALELGMRGPREPEELHGILTAYTKAFFDKYLLGIDSGFEKLEFAGTEVMYKPF